MPAHLRIRQPSLLYPNCCKSQSISHTPGLEIRGNVQFFFNKKHFLAFILAKENLEITFECSYRLPNQAAAVKKQVHISVSWLFSFSITVCQDLTHDFLNATKASISDRELWEVLMIYCMKREDSSLWCWAFQCCEQARSVVCLSRALSHGHGVHKPRATRSCPSQPSPSRTPRLQKQGSVLLLKGIHENFCLWHIHGDRVLPKTHTKGINPPEIWILFASYQNIHSKPRRHSTAKHWQEEMLIKH